MSQNFFRLKSILSGTQAKKKKKKVRSSNNAAASAAIQFIIQLKWAKIKQKRGQCIPSIYVLIAIVM